MRPSNNNVEACDGQDHNVDKRGRQALHDVPGTLAEVLSKLQNSHDGIAHFGAKWSATIIDARDVVAVAPIERRPAPVGESAQPSLAARTPTP